MVQPFWRKGRTKFDGNAKRHNLEKPDTRRPNNPNAEAKPCEATDPHELPRSGCVSTATWSTANVILSRASSPENLLS
ncbi:unnamed protein product [Protopolystoma xenopodis]|uniref:Uncharacterized protein n=1 Tax=Protopolystoma xenopodis TaxID=117903 RepID=A0A3S5CRF9_9PLAT|nr:unnamed protein product [Protopolystoma xenopodis]